MLLGTDCDVGLHVSMDGTSNAVGHLERAGDINLSDVDDRTGIVQKWLE